MSATFMLASLGDGVTVRSRVCGNAGEIKNPATIRSIVTSSSESFDPGGIDFISTSFGLETRRARGSDAGRVLRLFRERS
jgi:hypothetical protein